MVRDDDVTRMMPWLRALANKLARDRTDADDLVQETWLAALRHPPDRRLPLEPWLARVLRNSLLMRRRTDARRMCREAAMGQPEPELEGDATERTERLEALLAELGEPFRGTIRLRYHEGLSAAEIARRQGVPAGTVRWRLKTGLDRLRAGLGAKVHRDRLGAAILVVLVVVSLSLVWVLGRKHTRWSPRVDNVEDAATVVVA